MLNITVKQSRAEVKDWADKHDWLLLKSTPKVLVYAAPSGHLVTFFFTDDTLFDEAYCE